MNSYINLSVDCDDDKEIEITLRTEDDSETFILVDGDSIEYDASEPIVVYVTELKKDKEDN